MELLPQAVYQIVFLDNNVHPTNLVILRFWLTVIPYLSIYNVFMKRDYLRSLAHELDCVLSIYLFRFPITLSVDSTRWLVEKNFFTTASSFCKDLHMVNLFSPLVHVLRSLCFLSLWLFMQKPLQSINTRVKVIYQAQATRLIKKTTANINIPLVEWLAKNY